MKKLSVELRNLAEQLRVHPEWYPPPERLDACANRAVELEAQVRSAAASTSQTRMWFEDERRVSAEGG